MDLKKKLVQFINTEKPSEDFNAIIAGENDEGVMGLVCGSKFGIYELLLQLAKGSESFGDIVKRVTVTLLKEEQEEDE